MERGTKKLGGALGFLGLALLVFAWMTLGGRAPDRPPGGAVIREAVGVGAARAGVAVEAALEVDLLALCGSHIPGTGVGEAMEWLPPVAPGPAVETSAGPIEVAADQPPPAMRVTLILRAGRIRRAVVDGKVIGVGDPVVAGRVIRIAADGVEVEAQRRTWFYEINRLLPRGYESGNGECEDGTR